MNDNLRCVAPAGDICGEGAVWHPTHNVLYWTDINRFLVHRFDSTTGAVESWLFDEPVTSINLTTEDDRFVLTLASRAVVWSPRSHPEVETLYSLAAAPAMRLNEARVDPRGSLWAGTMRNNVGPRGENLDVQFAGGVLYRIDPDEQATEWKREIGISNTMAWSPDAKTFYFGDSNANVLWAFDYDAESGSIAGERILLADFNRGLPDGSAMDAEGFLWNARYDGGCVVRIAPDGRIDRVVELPVARPTTCAFGGPDRRTLYITSARSSEQFSGSLFALELEVSGVPDGKFRVA